MTSSEIVEIQITSITREARDINSYELRARPGTNQQLPRFTAGSHIDLHLPNGLQRSYSLVNSQDERDRYVIAVALDKASRGGSRYLHENLRVGDTLPISFPRNNFPLDEMAQHSLLIAGGIGITPLLSMAQRLQDLGRSWELIYCSRTRLDAAYRAFLMDLKEKANTNLRFNFDNEPGGQMLDIGGLINCATPETHFYCCGPLPMLKAYEKATAGIPTERVHIEYFSPKEAPASQGGFTVVLQRKNMEVFVPAGKTVLDTLLDLGIDAPYSCMEGTCGECVTTVLSGIPDHRDVFLTKEEQLCHNKMTICCSGSLSERLILDM